MKKYLWQCYRGRYGGCDWVPKIYWTKAYKEINWLVWLVSLTNEEEMYK